MTLHTEFIVTHIERSLTFGSDSGEATEVCDVTLIPLPAQGDDDQNRDVWETETNGEIILRNVTAEAARHFELGKTIHIDSWQAGCIEGTASQDSVGGQ